MNKASEQRAHLVPSFLLILGLISLLPWILLGLLGPYSDAESYLIYSAGKYGLLKLAWDQQLFTTGPTLLLAPLLFFFRNHWFYWIGSSAMACASVAISWGFWRIMSNVCRHSVPAAVAALALAFHPLLHQFQFYWMTELVYAGALFPGLYFFNLYINSMRRSHLVCAVFWLFLAYLMRPQGILAFYIAAFILLLIVLKALIKKTNTCKDRVIDLLIFIVLPFMLAMPFRFLNRVHHGTWLMNKMFGANCGFYLQMEGGFSPQNGPISRQVVGWSQSLLPEFHLFRSEDINEPIMAAQMMQPSKLNHHIGELFGIKSLSEQTLMEIGPTRVLNMLTADPRLYRFMPDGALPIAPKIRAQLDQLKRNPFWFTRTYSGGQALREINQALLSAYYRDGMIQNPKVVVDQSKDPLARLSDNDLSQACERAESIAEAALNNGRIHYQAPRNIFYVFTRDWRAADDAMFEVSREAVMHDPRRYIRWALKMSRWYLTGKSENPDEWQADYLLYAILKRRRTIGLQLPDHVVDLKAIGGLAYDHPKIWYFYDALRTVFAKTITYMKKTTFYTFPLLGWLLWHRRPRDVLIFFVLCMIVHLVTALAVGMAVGYHHRYNAPLDLFTLFYLGLWLDLLTDLSV